MNDHLFRTKAPEVLLDLAAHTASSIRKVLDVAPVCEVAEQIGQAVANNMMRVWGGQNIYMPLGISWKLSQRDRDIFNECNGRNHHELVRKYGGYRYNVFTPS